MSFREKSAWIHLICAIATFGLFFGAMALGLIDDQGDRSFALFFTCVAIYVAMQIVLHLVASATTPKDSKVSFDEREELIRLKGARNAYLVLTVGIVLVPASMHIGFQQPGMGYLAMAALTLGEVVRAASQIVYFRRGP